MRHFLIVTLLTLSLKPVLAQAPDDSTRNDVFVTLEGFPDLSGADDFAEKEAKAQYVYDLLQAHGQQFETLFQPLRDSSLAFEYLWAAGALYVADIDSVSRANLMADARVACVSDALNLAGRPDPKEAEQDPLSARSVTTWGLDYIGAPEVWAQGVRGRGAVVGGQDTGYDWDHPALARRYRGYQFTDSAIHDYNWFDAVEKDSPLTNATAPNPCGYSADVACDDGSHGTHTMGTMVGMDGVREIGVAPEAEWIGCRSMERGWGRPETYIRCFQWFVAPTDTDGETPRPDLAPDVIANSWYCPLMEGCDDCTFGAFDNVIAALRASGVVVVASAGNAGRGGCNTVNRIPAQSPGAIAVAAHDINGDIAGFSSRGTSAEPLDGPDIAAPGVDVRSSVTGGGYSNFSGTSMAGPHVAGVVALMVSANPQLRGQVDSIEAILLRSATPVAITAEDSCSAAGGLNQTFGQGYLNAALAVAGAQAFGTTSNTSAFAKTLPVRIAPNPVGGLFTVELPRDAVGGEFAVFDGVGRLVLRREVRTRRVLIESADWAEGNYVWRVAGPGGAASGVLVR